MINFFKKYGRFEKYIPFAIITLSVIISSFLFASHSMQILSDRGRELLIPLSVLNGQVPYKDILIIYFPLAYYINAVFFGIFGSSLSAVYIIQTVYCIIFSNLFFLISKEFFNKKISLLLTLLIIESCLFSPTVFGYILPYSYSLTYGMLASLLFVYCFVKLFKTDNKKYSYLTCFFAGAAVCFKAEFLPLIIILIAGLCLYKKESFTFYAKNLLSFFTVPFLLLITMALNGVSLQNCISAAAFGFDFTHTFSMKFFLQSTGMLPNFNHDIVKTAVQSLWGVFVLISSALIYMKINSLTKNKIIIWGFALFSFMAVFLFTEPYYYTFFLPLTVFLLFLLNFKRLIKTPCEMLVVLISLFLSSKVFFGMKMNLYGTYFFPLLIISLLIFLNKYSEKIKKYDMKEIFCFIIIIGLVFYSAMNFICKKYSSYPLKSAKGVVHIPEKHGELLSAAVEYINKNTSENDKILVLPEGSVLNFLANRPCDMKIHILDRLHYDTWGDKKSKELLEKSDYDYIILAKGFSLSDFGASDFYSEDNEVTRYLSSEYKVAAIYENNPKENKIIILKKNKKTAF